MIADYKPSLPPVRVGCADILRNRSFNSVAGAFSSTTMNRSVYPGNALKGHNRFVSIPMPSRFLKKIILPNDCWIWKGTKRQRGYGVFYFEGKQVPAHRLAWELYYGIKMPKHLDACHTCDNPSCVNPLHIWPGTASENAIDALQKGRFPWAVKMFCKRGHSLSIHNLHPRKDGRRECKICRAIHNAAKDKKDRENRAAKRMQHRPCSPSENRVIICTNTPCGEAAI